MHPRISSLAKNPFLLLTQVGTSAKIMELIVIPEKSQILSGIWSLFHRDPRHFLRKFGDDTVRFNFRRDLKIGEGDGLSVRLMRQIILAKISQSASEIGE